MVSVYGLNDKIGNLSFYDSSGRSEYNFTKPYSEKTAQIIDEEVSKIIAKAYNKAKQILIKHKKDLITLNAFNTPSIVQFIHRNIAYLIVILFSFITWSL